MIDVVDSLKLDAHLVCLQNEQKSELSLCGVFLCQPLEEQLKTLKRGFVVFREVGWVLMNITNKKNYRTSTLSCRLALKRWAEDRVRLGFCHHEYTSLEIGIPTPSNAPILTQPVTKISNQARKCQGAQMTPK